MLRPNDVLNLRPNVGDEASLLCTEPEHGVLPSKQKVEIEVQNGAEKERKRVRKRENIEKKT